MAGHVDRKDSRCTSTRRSFADGGESHRAYGNESTPRRVVIDAELGREAFTYRLACGAEGSVHVDSVLDVNADPDYHMYGCIPGSRGRRNSTVLTGA